MSNRVFIPPTPEMVEKIRKSHDDVEGQSVRSLRCPYCRHCAIKVFDDARGHVQAKCKVCGKETVFDVLNMRRLPTVSYRRAG